MHMQLSRPQKQGFTIVELLIVIVVVAILAAISIITYQGIRQRAENTRTINAVSSYYRGLIAYATLHGSYPSHGAGQPCLGTGYDCVGMGNQIDEFNDQLAPFLGNTLPQPSTQRYSYMTFERVGAAYYNIRHDVHLDGVYYPYFINYILGGVTSCGGVPGLVSIDAMGWPFYSSQTPSDGRTETDGRNTYCSLALPPLGSA